MTPKDLKISVIIPTYNRANYLNKLLERLSDQSIDKNTYEVIVVDNNSIDNTKKIVNKYMKSNKIFIQYIFEKRQGLHFSRHTGAKVSNSEILAYIDDDAICNENWLEELLKIYVDESIGCAGGKIIIRWDKKVPSWVIPYEGVLGRLDYGQKSRILNHDEYINGANFSIRKKVLFDVGGFNPDQIGDHLIGDGETGLCKKLYKKSIKIAWIPNAIVWHIQIVSKNATKIDIKRRFINNGIADAYAFYKEKKYGKFNLLINSFKSLANSFRYKLYSLLQRIIKNDNWYRYEMSSVYCLSKAIYQLRIIFNRKLRKMVLEENWIK